jgi:hypothetical protein
MFFVVSYKEFETGIPNSYYERANMQDEDWQYRYLTTLYWGVVTMVTVGTLYYSYLLCLKSNIIF